MGRAMLIFCAAALIAIGFINMTTSKKGLSLVEQNVNYADFIMAKNAAHTAIQISMQKINKDDTWADTHNEGNPWKTTINERDVELYTVHNPSPDFWEPDELRMISNARHNDITVQVISQYLKEPFSALVPEFKGALQLPTEIGEFNVDGNAYGINGTPPPAHNCPEVKPAVAVHAETTKEKVDDAVEQHNQVDGDIIVDHSLSYEPTDELIERLYNSGNAITVTPEYGDQLGTSDNPGVFFIEGDVKLTGRQSEGYGIMVIRSGGNIEYEGDDGASLEVAGNFEFNGLIIFENAYDFDGRGTPTINGSVLVGNTPDYDGEPIDIDLGGNININYDCKGEDYARQAAALAVEQYKYTRIVTSEGVNYFHDQPFSEL
jgi:hypothetical protein